MDIDGDSLGVQVKGGNMDVNGTHVTTLDIFASNGVVHIIDDLLLPHDFKLLNSPEKQLLSLNATRFVSLLRMANLSETYTARHSAQPYTILAPTDDVLERMGRWDKPIWGSLLDVPLASGSPAVLDKHFADVLRQQLLYHILPQKLSLKDLKDGMLLETELAPDGLGGRRQRIKVDVGPHKDNGDKVLSIGDIKIGDAVLTAEPGEFHGAQIRVLSDDLPSSSRNRKLHHLPHQHASGTPGRLDSDSGLRPVTVNVCCINFCCRSRQVRQKVLEQDVFRSSESGIPGTRPCDELSAVARCQARPEEAHVVSHGGRRALYQ